MGHRGIIRTFILLIAAASFLALGLRAQDEPSVADAARRARQQKQASAKPSAVVTNDTLRPAPTPAPAPSALPADAPATSTEDSTEAAESPERKAETDDEAEQKKRDVAKLKEEIAQKQQQLKFLNSDLALKQDTFYGNPDHQHDADGKTKLDSVKSDIKQAEDELAALQAKLAGLGPASEAEPAPPSER